MRKISSFTLLETLIVIGVLAALAVTIIMIINPGEFLKEARDSTRLSDLRNVYTALKFYEIDRTGFMGTSSIVYVSIPDIITTCVNLGLPDLPDGWSYNCASQTNLRKIDGSGWIPVNFSSITYNSPIAKLPTDPINTTTTGNYYTYVTGGSWELTAMMETAQYRMGGSQDRTSTDGGDSYGLLEIGSNLTLNPIKETYGLVGYYKFKEGTGTSTADSSGNGYNGAITAGAGGWFGGKAFGAYDFDGANTKIDTGSNWIGTATATISAWIYADSFGEYGIGIIITNSSTSFFMNSGSTNLSFSSGIAIYTPGYSILTGRWYHVAVTRTSAGIANFYINGVLSGTANQNSGTPTAGTTNVIIGNSLIQNMTFDGRISDLRVYNRVLSAAEIQAIYNSTQ